MTVESFPEVLLRWGFSFRQFDPYGPALQPCHIENEGKLIRMNPTFAAHSASKLNACRILLEEHC